MIMKYVLSFHWVTEIIDKVGKLHLIQEIARKMCGLYNGMD